MLAGRMCALPARRAYPFPSYYSWNPPPTVRLEFTTLPGGLVKKKEGKKRGSGEALVKT